MWFKCYLAAGYLLNLILIKALHWLSLREAEQKILSREISYQLIYLKVYDCKCYALLKGKEGNYKPKKLNKLALRVFVEFLISYDLANIYRVQNPVKNKVKGYRDIIFNKRVTYYPFIKDNIIKEKEKIKQNYTINFIIYRAKIYYNKLKEDKLKYLDTHFSQCVYDFQEEEEKQPKKILLLVD